MILDRRNTIKAIAATSLGAVTVGVSATPVFKSGQAFAESHSGVMSKIDNEKVMGDENAPVTIVEYSSMTCPHCATFHSNILPYIKENYIDKGKAKLYFREFPVSVKDVRSIAAFMLARCAPEDKYFPLVDVLYKQQTQWARAENPVPILLNIAKLAGFSQESFNACLKNQEVMDTVVSIRNKAADDYGVSGTPTFFINGTKQVGTTSSAEEFGKLIEDAM